MMFHAGDGLYFRAYADGVVEVTAYEGTRLVFRTKLSAHTWASVVAKMCGPGEDANTFRKALQFHLIGDLKEPITI